MKISVADLRKALKWIEANSNDTHVNIEAYSMPRLLFYLKDKYEKQVEITLFADSNMMPKIKKEEIL